jgi:osmoprotectant transport system ATP-binding protein
MSDQSKKVMISLRGVRKTFAPDPARRRTARKGTPAAPAAVRVTVDDLQVHEGELLVLLGGSGSGKTTTLKMINRLIDPDEGTIEVNGRTIIKDGRPVDGERPEKLRREIGYVIQGSGLFPHMNVEQNVSVVPRLLGPRLGWDKKAIAARVEELLRLVQLTPVESYLRRMPDSLSGGQQQRVGFARAVAARPRLMLLDEPFGALDPIMRDEVRTAFQAIRRNENLTAVMVTHDMTEALTMADRIAVMHQGAVLQCGTPQKLLNEPDNEYVRKLIKGSLDETKQVEKLLAGRSAGGLS